jgi:hypothetical protein
MAAVRIPKEPPAVATAAIPVNSAMKSKRKVMSKKKNKRTRPSELRKEATNFFFAKKKNHGDGDGELLLIDTTIKSAR